MASPLQQIVKSVALTGTAALLYTSPAGVWTQIVALTATNIDASSHTITLNIVPSGGSAGTGNVTTPALGLLAGTSYNGRNECGQILGPGDALWGAADAPSVVNVFASGLLSTS